MHRRQSTSSTRRSLTFVGDPAAANSNLGQSQICRDQIIASDHVGIHGQCVKEEDETVNDVQASPRDQVIDEETNSDGESLKLPVEISFLVRQHAYSLARINRLERQLNELRNEVNAATQLQQQQQQQQQLQLQATMQRSNPVPIQFDPDDPLHSQWLLSHPPMRHYSSNHYNYANNQFDFTPVPFQQQSTIPFQHQYHSYQQPLNNYENFVTARSYNRQLHNNNNYVQTATVGGASSPFITNHATSANVANIKGHGSQSQGHGHGRNLNLSDDSGGEYSRATVSDNDELSSLLDQILRISSTASSTSSNVNVNANANSNSNQHNSTTATITTTTRPNQRQPTSSSSTSSSTSTSHNARRYAPNFEDNNIEQNLLNLQKNQYQLNGNNNQQQTRSVMNPLLINGQSNGLNNHNNYNKSAIFDIKKNVQINSRDHEERDTATRMHIECLTDDRSPQILTEHDDIIQRSIDSQLDEADNWLKMQQYRISKHQQPQAIQHQQQQQQQLR